MPQTGYTGVQANVWMKVSFFFKFVQDTTLVPEDYVRSFAFSGDHRQNRSRRDTKEDPVVLPSSTATSQRREWQGTPGHDLRPTLTPATKLWSALRSPCRFLRNSRQSARTTRMWSLPAIQEEERKVSSRPGNSRVLETNQKCRYHDHG